MSISIVPEQTQNANDSIDYEDDFQYYPTSVNERFSINSPEAADWLLSKLAALDAEEMLIREQSMKRLSRIASYRTRLKDFYWNQLEQFAAAQIGENGKRKSIDLAHGTINFRKCPSRIVIGDPSAAFTYAQTLPHPPVLVKTSLDPDAYRRLALATLTANGELLPGTEFIPERESMSIAFGGSK